MHHTHFGRRALLSALGAGTAALALPRPARAAAPGVFAQVTDTQDGRPPAPPAPWRAIRPELKASPLHAYEVKGWGCQNARAFATLERVLRNDPAAEVQLAVVPGSSELLGPHTAWAKKLDNHWVEPQFRARLRHAYLLLEAGVVKGLVISGGPVDAKAPNYVEGLYGFKELVEQFGARWRASPLAKGDPLESRVIVDPWAVHLEDCVRNGDRAALLLGLDRSLVVTAGGKHQQGWWLSHHKATALAGELAARWGAFDRRCEKALGYTLGAFGAIAQAGDGPFGTGEAALPRVKDAPRAYAKEARKYLAGDRQDPPSLAGGKELDTVAVAHWGLNAAAVLADPKWDAGARE